MARYKEIMDLLNVWRLLPRYELERRVDALIALHLHDIIASCLFLVGENRKIIDVSVIPEFPILVNPNEKYNPKRKKNSNDPEMNSTHNVDFLLFCNIEDYVDKGCVQKVYLVEIKTDAKSFRAEQLSVMKSNCMCVHKLISGVIDIAGRTTEKAKYAYLLENVNGVLTKNPGYIDTKAEILYICPEKLKEKIREKDDSVLFITLKEIGDVMVDNNNALDNPSNYFYRMLSSWDESVNKTLKVRANGKPAREECTFWSRTVDKTLRSKGLSL